MAVGIRNLIVPQITEIICHRLSARDHFLSDRPVATLVSHKHCVWLWSISGVLYVNHRGGIIVNTPRIVARTAPLIGCVPHRQPEDMVVIPTDAQGRGYDASGAGGITKLQTR